MKPAKELTREEIAPALAEAQGWADSQDYLNLGHLQPSWVSMEHDGCYRVHATQDEYPTDIHFMELALNPEMHAGMIDVLDGWLSIYDEQIPYRAAIEGAMTPVMWQHNPEYLQDIRLWQMRAVIEYLRGRK